MLSGDFDDGTELECPPLGGHFAYSAAHARRDDKLFRMDTFEDIEPDPEAGPRGFDAELDAFLDTALCADAWCVERLLKRSELETTEVVVREFDEGVAAHEAHMPVRAVRKRIDGGESAGSAYEVLQRAQRQGIRIEGVPQIYECVRTGRTLHVLMEYIKGPSLEAFVAGIGPGMAVVRDLAPALCRTVHDLHTRLEAPLIHRDLKPSNIIVRAGEPWVIDFGISRVWHKGAESDTSHFATRCYAPPEQFGFGQTDERSDVYALGKIFYFCLTGEQPPNVCTEEACKDAGIDTCFAAMIGKACSFNPGDRHARVRDLAQAVERCLEAGESLELSGARPRGAMPNQSDGFHGSSREMPAPFEMPPSFSHGTSRLQAVRNLHDELRMKFEVFCEGRTSVVLGKIWNALVIGVACFLLSACIYLVVCPNERDAALPFWFRFMEYIVMLGGIIVVLALLVFDRRRVGARFPMLARRSVLFEIVAAFGVSLFLVLFTSLCAMIAGIA